MDKKKIISATLIVLLLSGSTWALTNTTSMALYSQKKPAAFTANGLTVVSAQKKEAALLAAVDYHAEIAGYPVVDTGQTDAYNASQKISKPTETSAFYGQDSNFIKNPASYTDNGDGTLTDNVTGLIWQKDPGPKMTWNDAVNSLNTYELAGYDDWRIPTIKELYSLIQFNGITGLTAATSKPYIDSSFVFSYGDKTGERFIDSQFASSTIYDSTTMNGNTTVFGVNFADGRIKGYPISKSFYVLHVRGNTAYGENLFVDNHDGTISDQATGLMWMAADSGMLLDDGTMDWTTALNWAKGASYAGYDDWRIPDAKELQTIVDYQRTPDTTGSAAINPLFGCTPITNEAGKKDFGYYWSSTTHLDGKNPGNRAVYLSFGRAIGQMNKTVMDVHGAGAQRIDPKSGSASDYPRLGQGPQGDSQRVFNLVRLVRYIE